MDIGLNMVDELKTEIKRLNERMEELAKAVLMTSMVNEMEFEKIWKFLKELK